MDDITVKLIQNDCLYELINSSYQREISILANLSIKKQQLETLQMTKNAVIPDELTMQISRLQDRQDFEIEYRDFLKEKLNTIVTNG